MPQADKVIPIWDLGRDLGAFGLTGTLTRVYTYMYKLIYQSADAWSSFCFAVCMVCVVATVRLLYKQLAYFYRDIPCGPGVAGLVGVSNEAL